MIQEANLESDGYGLAPSGEGWFVVNAREGRWRHRPGRGEALTFTGYDDEECERLFPQLGVNLFVLPQGETIGMYHLEAETEAFLVLTGDALLLIEGEERPLRQWDFVHCPPGTEHIILGAGYGCAVLAIGARDPQFGPADWGAYTVHELAIRHGVGVEEETPDAEIAYARFEATRPTRYQEDWLPGE